VAVHGTCKVEIWKLTTTRAGKMLNGRRQFADTADLNQQRLNSYKPQRRIMTARGLNDGSPQSTMNGHHSHTGFYLFKQVSI
jgi:hypothetical protein